MGSNQYGSSAFKDIVSDDFAHRHANDRVQSVKSFVQQQIFWHTAQSQNNCNLAAHSLGASGELAFRRNREAFYQLSVAGCRPVWIDRGIDLCQRIHRSPRHLIDLVGNKEKFGFKRRIFVDILAVNHNAAFGRGVDSGKQPQKGGFSSTVSADDRHEIARCQV